MIATKTRVSANQSTVSNSLILIIVAVIFSTFYMTSRPTAYSIRSDDRDHMDLSASAITTGSTERRIALISFGVFWGLLFFRRRRLPFSVRGVLYWLIFAYIFWAVISIFWADDHQLVMRRIFALIILCFSAFSMSINISLRQLPMVILWTSLLVLIIGIFSEFEAGIFSLSIEGYRFAGTVHANAQAKNCAMLLVAATIMAKSDSRMTRLFYRSIMLIAFFFLLLTRSRTTFVSVMIALLVYNFYATKRSKILIYVYITVLVFCIAFLIFGDAFLSMLGAGVLLGRQEEEITELHGRQTLWVLVIEYAKKRPICGYGFHGFWTEGRVRAISDSEDWGPSASHSMYIELLVNLGLVGLGLFLMMIIRAWWTARGAYSKRNDVGMGFALSLLTLWILLGVLTTPFNSLHRLTYLLFVVLFSIARESVLSQNAQKV